MKKVILLLTLISLAITIHSQSDFNKWFDNSIYDFYSEEDTVWICTGDGFLIKALTDGTILDSIVLIHDIKDNALYSVAIDTNGIKWIATEGRGVFSFDGDTLRNYTTSDGLAFNYTTSIAVDNKNQKWIGTEGKGISVFDDMEWRGIKVTEDEKEVVYSIKIDRNDTKWISTYFGIYEYTDTVVNKYNLDSYGYLSNGTLIDSKGNVWFGTSGDGIYRFSGMDWTHYTISDGLIDGWVLSLHEDIQGNIWYGSKMFGISIFNGEKWISIPNNELEAMEINAILVTPTSPEKWKSADYFRLWIGTDDGLYINEAYSLNNHDIENNKAKIFPNPTSDFILVDGYVQTKPDYSITDICGHIVKSGTMNDRNIISLRELKNGIYLLHIDDTVYKIIKNQITRR